ncbi:hypothetical protein GCM10027590_32770 [Nocardiopsis nanhaiensis]
MNTGKSPPVDAHPRVVLTRAGLPTLGPGLLRNHGVELLQCGRGASAVAPSVRRRRGPTR